MLSFIRLAYWMSTLTKVLAFPLVRRRRRLRLSQQVVFIRIGPPVRGRIRAAPGISHETRPQAQRVMLRWGRGEPPFRRDLSDVIFEQNRASPDQDVNAREAQEGRPDSIRDLKTVGGKDAYVDERRKSPREAPRPTVDLKCEARPGITEGEHHDCEDCGFVGAANRPALDTTTTAGAPNECRPGQSRRLVRSTSGRRSSLQRQRAHALPGTDPL